MVARFLLEFVQIGCDAVEQNHEIGDVRTRQLAY